MSVCRLIFLSHTEVEETWLKSQLLSNRHNQLSASLSSQFQIFKNQKRIEENQITFSISDDIVGDLGLCCIDLSAMQNGQQGISPQVQNNLNLFRELNPTKKIILIGTNYDRLKYPNIEDKKCKAEALLKSIEGDFYSRFIIGAGSEITQLQALLASAINEDVLLATINRIPEMSLLHTAVENLHEKIQPLPPQKYQILQNAIIKFINKLLDKDKSDKAAIIDEFITNCHICLDYRYPTAAKAVIGLAIATLVTLLLITCGFFIGFSLGVWITPAALLIGLLAGETAAVSVVSVSSLLGVGFGLYTFFDNTDTVRAVHLVADEAQEFEPRCYPS